MSGILEVISAASGPLTTFLVGYIGLKGKYRFSDLTKKINELELTNKREHSQLGETINYVNSRESLSRALVKVCNSSISYTVGNDELNSFKTSYGDAMVRLSISTLMTGFKFLNEDIFRGYVVISRANVKKSSLLLPDRYIELISETIYDQTTAYYETVLEIISDDVFNDKHDRFVDATIQHLRKQLMTITKSWWKYSEHINEKS